MNIDELFERHAEDIWASDAALADVLESANFLEDVARIIFLHKDPCKIGGLIVQQASNIVDNEAGYRARCEQTGEEI